MKQLLCFILLVFVCFSCHKKEGYISFATDDTSSWNIEGRVDRNSDELSLLERNARAITTTSYRDFILEFECKTSPEAIGALIFHSNGYDCLKRGYEVLINNNPSSAEWRKTGSLSSIRNYGKCLAENDTWVKMKIEVAGVNIKVYVDDYWVVDYFQPNKPFRLPEYQCRTLSKGVFVFANYSDVPISFRNVQVKPLFDIPSNIAQAMDEEEDELIRLHQKNFPLFDTDIRLVDGLTAEDVDALTRKYGITYGVKIQEDRDVPEEKGKHLFMIGMQAGDDFSAQAVINDRNRFDYVSTNKLPDINSGHIDIICGLDTLSEEIINLCVNNKVAIEIDSRRQMPSAEAILFAKERGATFSFATGNCDLEDVGRTDYRVDIIKSCELNPQDIFIPLTQSRP